MRTRILGGIAVLGVAFVAGCGGGGSSTSATGASGASGASGVSGATPLSQDEFVTQANAICKDVNDQVAALPAPQTTADLAPITQKIVDISNAALPKLDQIVPPADLQAKWEQFVTTVKSQIPLAEDLVKAAKAGDTAQIQQISGKLKASSPDPIAKDLGLTECSKNVQPGG